MVYLGSIVTINGTSVNNTTTAGTPFTILPIYPWIMIVTPADSGSGTDTYKTTVNIGSLTATSNDYAVAGGTAARFACPIGYGVNSVVAILGNVVGTVKVYGLWGNASS